MEEKMNQNQIESQKLIEEDVLTRLKEELKELEDKVYKLHDVLYTNKKLIFVIPMQAILMKQQYDAMCEYQRILRRRIRNLSIFLEIDEDDGCENDEGCDETEDEPVKKIGNYDVVSLTEGPGKKYVVDLNNPDDVWMIYSEWKEFKEGKYSKDHYDRVDECLAQKLCEQCRGTEDGRHAFKVPDPNEVLKSILEQIRKSFDEIRNSGNEDEYIAKVKTMISKTREAMDINCKSGLINENDLDLVKKFIDDIERSIIK